MATPLGFIGLGNIGFPMMSRLVGAGHPVVVFDTRPAVVERAAGLGAQPATSVRDVADRAETVLASLPTPRVSAAVVAELADGSRVRRFVDLSTVGSQAAQRIHAQLSERDIAALDSPVSGGVAGAERGTLALMVSGARAEYEVVAPVLAVLGRPILVGEQPGAAQTMKLVNNLMAATALAATAEVMVMGVKAGLDPRTIYDVIRVSTGTSYAFDARVPRILSRDFSPTGTVDISFKDQELETAFAKQLGVPLFLANVSQQVYQMARAAGLGKEDGSAIIKVLERMAGVTVKGGA